jgi:hypothetical protein
LIDLFIPNTSEKWGSLLTANPSGAVHKEWFILGNLGTAEKLGELSKVLNVRIHSSLKLPHFGFIPIPHIDERILTLHFWR